MEIIKGIVRFVIFLCILGFFVGIWYVFRLPGLIVSILFSLLLAIYQQQRQLKRMIEKLDKKISNMER